MDTHAPSLYKAVEDPQRRCLLGVLLFLTLSCAARANPPQVGLPAAWERVVDGAFEHRGVGKIERIASRWALTVLCTGTHSTYLDDTTMDLASYDNRFIRARYRYVDRTVPDPRCVMAPCRAITERRVLLEKVTIVAVTPEQAAQSTRECSAEARKGPGRRAVFARGPGPVAGSASSH